MLASGQTPKGIAVAEPPVVTHPVLRCSACDMIMLQSASKRLSLPLCRLKQQDLLGTALQLLEQPCAAAQVLLNSMLKVEQARLDAAHDSFTNGHASASEEENRPKPCVPKAEQIRVHSGAPHSMKRESLQDGVGLLSACQVPCHATKTEQQLQTAVRSLCSCQELPSNAVHLL